MRSVKFPTLWGGVNISVDIKRKDRIVLTTIEIIHELGFQGLTTKEISRREQFSEGSLYKHFRSKDEIILAALDYCSKFDEDIKQTIVLKKLKSKESIRYLITRYAEYYEKYPAMTAILNSYEILRNEAGIAHKIVEIFEFDFDLMMNIIEEGIKNGEFKSDIDSNDFSDVILGFRIAITLRWRMRQYNFNLKDKLLATLNMVLKAY